MRAVSTGRRRARRELQKNGTTIFGRYFSEICLSNRREREGGGEEKEGKEEKGRKRKVKRRKKIEDKGKKRGKKRKPAAGGKIGILEPF